MCFTKKSLKPACKFKVIEEMICIYGISIRRIGVGKNYKGTDVVKTLMEAMKYHGVPKVLRVDNGPEFVSKD